MAGNKCVDDRFFENAKRLPNNPLGLNDYAGIHDLAFLSALNPSRPHCAFLIDRGVKSDEIAQMQYLETVYQSVMRISLRDPEDPNQKTIIVPDLRAAEYLAEKLPGATIRKLETGIVEEVKRPGRKKIHGSNAEKSREWRKKKKDEKREHLLQLVRSAQDHSGDCGSDTRDEMAIDLVSDFVTDHLCWGTAYSRKNSKDALGYLQYGSTEQFIKFLEDCSREKYDSKESIYLLAPAMFDPARAEGTNRGFANIVSVQNLFLDFENGDLSPDGFATLFPDLQMVITNTFYHTNDKPRFRVIIMIDQPIAPEVYEALFDEVKARLEDEGYVKKPPKGSNRGRSGLDGSKRSATSLFRLPCQALKSSDSFFNVYMGPERKPLDPAEWIRSAKFEIPDYELSDAPPVQPSCIPVDQSKVDAAIAIWRSTEPGKGNEEFWMLGVRLRDLGMAPHEIEAILKQQAGKNPPSKHDRERQIPSIVKNLFRRSTRASV